MSAASWSEIKNHLEQKKNKVYEEIVNYPPPIPACDTQFNHLLEKRDYLSQALRQAHELSQKESNYNDSMKLIDEFIESYTYIDDSLKAQLLLTSEAT